MALTSRTLERRRLGRFPCALFSLRHDGYMLKGDMRNLKTLLSTRPPAPRLCAWLRILATIVATSLPVVSIAMFILAPPSLEDIQWEPGRVETLRPFLDGQVALLAAWAALGGTAWYARWAVAAATFLLTTRTMWNVDFVTSNWFYLPWDIHTVLLLSFTTCCVLRAMGLRAAAVGIAMSGAPSPRQFTLRQLFGWVACAAALTLAWQHWYAFEVRRGQMWPEGLPDCRPLSFATASSFSIAGLVAALALLRRKPLRCWMLGLPLAVAAFHTTVYRLTFDFTVQPVGSTWWQSFVSNCRHNLMLHLGPVVIVLLLARAAGYRLAWSGGALDRVAHQPIAKRSVSEDTDMI